MAHLSGNRPGRQIDSTIDLHGLGETLLRRRWTILFCVVAITGLAFAALSVIAPRYSATARILVDPREQRAVQNEIVQQGLGGDMALVDSQIEVITSEAVLGRVVESMNLADDPQFGGEPGEGRTAADIAMEGLARATEVTRRDNTYVIEISVTTREAAKSARLANAIAAAYVADQISSAANSAREISAAIRGRLSELQKQLNDAEEDIETFKREHNISLTEGQTLGDRRLTDLSARQSEALSRVNEANSRLQVLEESLRTRGYVGATISDAGSAMGALRTRLADARQRLADLQNVLGPRHPRVTAAIQEVAQAETAIREESERLVASARDDQRIAVDALNKIDAELQSATAASFSTNQDLIRLRELEREAQSIRLVYESFLVRAQETTQQEGIAARTARVIAEAAVPASPSFPPRMPLLIAAVVMGVFTGILAAILLDFFAGLLGRGANISSLMPRPGAEVEVNGLVLVTTLHDPGMARQGALDLAQGAASRGRRAIFIDLAEDASTTAPGLADIALGEISAFGAVEADQASGLHVLNIGRPRAVERLSRREVSNVIEAVTAEYDDVVVNIGELETEHGLPARTVAELTRNAALVVNPGRVDAREQRMVEALSNDGAVAVSLVARGGTGRLDKVA